MKDFLEAFYPTTWTIGFFECPCAKMAEVMRTRASGFYRWQGIFFGEREVSGSFETVLASLLPLTDEMPHTRLLVPTKSSWVAWFDNNWLGGDQASSIDYLAQLAGARQAVRVTYEPGRSVVMDVHDGWGQLRRSIYVCRDGQRWKYYTHGEPFDFEQTDRYQARAIPERFTREMLADYLLHLGIDMFSPEFYQATAGEPGRLIYPRGVMHKVYRAIRALFVGRRLYWSFADALAARRSFYQEKETK